MKERVKNKWVKALRSGEYKQGHNRLLTVDYNSDESFCCLGVLCEIHAQETGGYWKDGVGTWEYSNKSDILPDSVREWSGVRDANGRAAGLNRSLAFINDSGQHDFNQIADVIEKHWEEL
jgi:hypothetical protein